ncbi:MAG: cupin domain-containing protein [Maricaulaceae bacterium]
MKHLSFLSVMFALFFTACFAPGLDSSDPANTRSTAIDPAIYSLIDDPNDPYREVYAEFRARRAADMKNPNFPEPLPYFPATHFTRDMPWTPIENILPLNREEMDQERVENLEKAVKMRLGFDHPDLKITQIMIGAGGILPAHADGAPGVYIGVGGFGEVFREGQTQTLTPGTTVKLNPYDIRRVAATGDEPVKLLWIRWAPDGDQNFFDAGYYLTGSNQHIQPEGSDMPLDYKFWGADYRTEPVDNVQNPAKIAPSGSFYEAQAKQLETIRSAMGDARELYPATPAFGHESDRNWLTKEQLKKGGFFFSKDAERFGAIADKMIAIGRHKGIFRAARSDGSWDFNISEMAWGPKSTYVEHSHLTPEFYYIMSGPVIYGVDGEEYEVMPGDIIHNNSYSPHLARGIVDGMPFDNFGASWAPRGDRSVFDRPVFWVEPFPNQPDSAFLPSDITFH